MYILKAILIWVYKFPYRLYKNFNNIDLDLEEAIVDPHGFGRMNLLIKSLHVPPKYEYLFYEMPDDALCIDGGGNAGKFTDLVLFCGGQSIIFEPNPFLVRLMQRKFKSNESVQIQPTAISTKNETVEFNFGEYTDQSGSMHKNKRNQSGIGKTLEVQAVDFAKYLKKLHQERGEIYLCKIDIEGAEFEVVEHLISTGAYRQCRHVVVETHPRFFKDGKARLKKLETLIADNKITNIDLGWF
jgi:FkbM family methyltransferase